VLLGGLLLVASFSYDRAPCKIMLLRCIVGVAAMTSLLLLSNLHAMLYSFGPETGLPVAGRALPWRGQQLLLGIVQSQEQHKQESIH